MPRRPEVDPTTYQQAERITLNETGDGVDVPEIEIVQDFDLKNVADLAKFMEEKVVIRLARKHGAKATELVSPSVNGRNQHVVRGYPQVVARKYIEVLLRSHETDYDYENEASTAILEGELPQPVTTPSYPFEILQDSEQGKRWFEALYNEQASNR